MHLREAFFHFLLFAILAPAAPVGIPKALTDVVKDTSNVVTKDLSPQRAKVKLIPRPSEGAAKAAQDGLDYLEQLDQRPKAPKVPVTVKNNNEHLPTGGDSIQLPKGLEGDNWTKQATSKSVAQKIAVNRPKSVPRETVATAPKSVPRITKQSSAKIVEEIKQAESRYILMDPRVDGITKDLYGSRLNSATDVAKATPLGAVKKFTSTAPSKSLITSDQMDFMTRPIENVERQKLPEANLQKLDDTKTSPTRKPKKFGFNMKKTHSTDNSQVVKGTASTTKSKLPPISSSKTT